MTAAELADANLIEALREHARWQDPCECVEQSGMLMVAGANALPVGYRNCVARVDGSVAPRLLIEAAREFFGTRKRGFSVLIRTSRDQDLEAALLVTGLKQRSSSPCMLIEAPIDDAKPSADIRIQRFAEEQHVLDAVAINAEAYQAIRLPPAETRIYFGRPTQLLSEHIIGFVAYRNGQPLSTALTIVAGKGAGVYWVGTVSAGQRQGLAALCTRQATNAGFARGATVVTLQASEFGEPVYRRLGYKTYDRMKWYS